jgi:hypothetical protein
MSSDVERKLEPVAVFSRLRCPYGSRNVAAGNCELLSHDWDPSWFVRKWENPVLALQKTSEVWEVHHDSIGRGMLSFSQVLDVGSIVENFNDFAHSAVNYNP